jgi:hypothetical protein
MQLVRHSPLARHSHEQLVQLVTSIDAGVIPHPLDASIPICFAVLEYVLEYVVALPTVDSALGLCIMGVMGCFTTLTQLILVV